jgi:XTP/dITP diphosphohydrolase
MEIRFVSGNRFKIDETTEIMKGRGIDIIPVNNKIEELQTLNVKNLVKDKLMKAFSMIGRPLFVEHTGLYIKYLNDFPSGLTQIFWDSLEADKFAKLIGNLPDTTVLARTIIGYCDGKQIHYFDGEINGNITDTPKGDRKFQWDCVFIPCGESKTFAEMGSAKNDISMRKQALEKFRKFLMP